MRIVKWLFIVGLALAGIALTYFIAMENRAAGGAVGFLTLIVLLPLLLRISRSAPVSDAKADLARAAQVAMREGRMHVQRTEGEISGMPSAAN